ncbi:MAG: EamA family transporter, partial [Thiolinea sp.]
QAFDAILLDIIMPEMDGFEVLQAIKSEVELRDIPVIVISALGDETLSVVKAIELGAEDFLPKDFDLIILQARLSACLTKKLFRDKEKEYYRQIEKLTQAASTLESGVFNPEKLGLDEVANQDSPLGRLAIVFRGMAGEIFERERKARQTINLLQAGLMVLALGTIGGLLPAVARMASNLGANSLGLNVWLSAAGAVIFLSIAAYKNNLPKFRWTYLAFFICWAVIDGVMHRTTVLIASAHVEAAMLALILSLQGFMAFGFAALLRTEKASPRRLAGLIAGLAGMLIALSDRLETSGSSHLLWYVFAMIPALVLAIEAIFIDKYKPEKVDDTAAIGMMLLFSTVILTPIAYSRDELLPLSWQLGQMEILVALLVFITVAVNILFLQIIKTAGAVFYGQSAYIRTVTGMIWGMLLLNEELTPLVWLSFIVIAVGIYLVSPKANDKELVIKRNFSANQSARVSN